MAPKCTTYRNCFCSVGKCTNFQLVIYMKSLNLHFNVFRKMCICKFYITNLISTRKLYTYICTQVIFTTCSKLGRIFIQRAREMAMLHICIVRAEFFDVILYFLLAWHSKFITILDSTWLHWIQITTQFCSSICNFDGCVWLSEEKKWIYCETSIERHTRSQCLHFFFSI